MSIMLSTGKIPCTFHYNKILQSYAHNFQGNPQDSIFRNMDYCGYNLIFEYKFFCKTFFNIKDGSKTSCNFPLFLSEVLTAI